MSNTIVDTIPIPKDKFGEFIQPQCKYYCEDTNSFWVVVGFLPNSKVAVVESRNGSKAYRFASATYVIDGCKLCPSYKANIPYDDTI